MKSSVFTHLLAVLCAVAAVEWFHAASGEPTVIELLRGPGPTSLRSADGSAFEPVTESEFQAYLDVLEEMQGDRSLSVEAAAARTGTGFTAFRDVERRVQRSDTLVERARQSLREGAERLWAERVGGENRG